MEINAQLMIFFTALAIGWLLGLIFDFYRIMRGVFRPKMAMTALMDGVYWLVAVAVAFVCLLWSNWAEMRFYIFFAIVGGWISYYKLASKWTIYGMLKGLRVFSAMVVWLRKQGVFWIVHPLGYFLGIFLYPFRYGGDKMRIFKNRALKSGKSEQQSDKKE